MKNLKTLILVSILAALTSCSSTKTTSASENQIIIRGKSNTEINATTNSRTTPRQTTMQNTMTVTEARDAEAANKVKMQKMYSELAMDEGQVSRFENEWKNAEITWKRNNRNKNLNSFERTELQDRILRDILNDQQFEKYQVWARQNAGKRN